MVSAPIGAYVQTLPLGYIAFTIGLSTFYFVNDTYFIWDGNRQGYYVVEKPEGAEQAIDNATTGRMYIYPKHEQNEEQQSKDRYECHRWAVSETDIDPTLDEEEPDPKSRGNYFRAMTACLEGRGYSVK